MDARNSVQFDTPLGQLYRKGRWVWTVLCTALNRLIRNKPRIAATTPIAPAGVRPTRNVGFILIRNSEREPVDWRVPLGREMKNIFVAIVQVAARIDRFEMSARNDFAPFFLNADRFDPVNGILQNEQIAQLQHQLVWEHRIGWHRADVEKKGTVRFQQTRNLICPSLAPEQITSTICEIGKSRVANPEIVRGRCDDKI